MNNREFDAELSHMIVSASGWRKVFAVSGNEGDTAPEIGGANAALAAVIADTFAAYITARTTKPPVVAVGVDTRPTGPTIADCVIRILCARNIPVRYLGITAAPEIMAYARRADAFVYISASHNPVGHNGIKFGLNDGGVLSAAEARELADMFRRTCADFSAVEKICAEAGAADSAAVAAVYAASAGYKQEALSAYRAFTECVVTGFEDPAAQTGILQAVKNGVQAKKLGIVCDMNGSARTLSVDSTFFAETGIAFYPIHNTPGEIAHAIIPEPENLVYCAAEMERLQKAGTADALLGYMPDCDGDRGNIVYWDSRTHSAKILAAQEVFALAVLAELSYSVYCGRTGKCAVAVNDPTSLRIEDIAAAFGAQVFRAEVGEANVVNLARSLRTRGYEVRILGEGSNGGSIVYPAAVRDPLNTLFSVIKLLTLRGDDGREGLFQIWCRLSGQPQAFRPDFTLADVISTLPVYTTTGVSEKRAVLHVRTADHAKLKNAYQELFESDWQKVLAEFSRKYDILSYVVIANNGIEEHRHVSDFGISGRGGLKILFRDAAGKDAAFIWMRGSGTEPVFRVLCDVKGSNAAAESELLAWHTSLILSADERCCRGGHPEC